MVDFVVGDIESILKNDGSWLFDLGNIFDGENHYLFDNSFEMFEKIKEINKPIYFHNLDFDFLFFLQNEMIEFKNVEIINSGGLMIQVNTEPVFKNSLAVLPMSLKDVVIKFLNITDDEWLNEKNNVLTLDYDVKIKYCQKDCFYLFKALELLFNTVYEKYNINNFLTIPSLSLKIFKKIYLNKEMEKSIFDVYNRNSFFNENFYFGGHTEKFYENYNYFSNVDYYDVNSLYPFVMEDLEFYQGKLEFIKPNKKQILKMLNKNEIFFCDIDIFIDCEDLRFIPIKDKNNINFYPSGLINCKVSNITIEYIYKIGFFDKIININALLTPINKEKIKLFDGFVCDMFQNRLLNFSYNIIFKLVLNSLYGKFGQKIDITRRFINVEDYNDYEWKSLTSYENNIITTSDDEISTFSKRFCRLDLAGIITEKARVYMAQNRRELEKNKIIVIYQDTDSIMLQNPLNKNLSKIIPTDNKKIGYFKKENEKKLNGYVLGQKIYNFQNIKKATKGVKKMNYEDFKNIDLYIQRENFLKYEKKIIKFFYKEYKFSLLDNYPNIKFYNTIFTKLHKLTSKKFFGINVTPYEFNLIRQRLDNNIFKKYMKNYDNKSNKLIYSFQNLNSTTNSKIN